MSGFPDVRAVEVRALARYLSGLIVVVRARVRAGGGGVNGEPQKVKRGGFKTKIERFCSKCLKREECPLLKDGYCRATHPEYCFEGGSSQ